MKVTVTGADGLLGSNLVRLLLEEGHSVRVFLQEGKGSPSLEGLDVERRYGDILDASSVRKAFFGSGAVIHAAASTSVLPSRSKLVRKINIQGTIHAINAAEQAQVDRFVYIGTANSFAPGPIDAPGDESTPYVGAKYGLDYMDSKYEAQQLVLKAMKERNLPALTVNPTFMIGPYDSTPSSGAMLIRLARGEVPGYTSGGKCWTHVRDVASAAANALTKGRTGECYIAGNENLDYGDFFRLAAGIIGVKAPRFKLPRPLVLASGVLGSTSIALTGRTPLLSLPMAKIACEGHYYNPSKAREELQMTSTSLELAVEESFSWLKENGYLEVVK